MSGGSYLFGSGQTEKDWKACGDNDVEFKGAANYLNDPALLDGMNNPSSQTENNKIPFMNKYDVNNFLLASAFYKKQVNDPNFNTNVLMYDRVKVKETLIFGSQSQQPYGQHSIDDGSQTQEQVNQTFSSLTGPFADIVSNGGQIPGGSIVYKQEIAEITFSTGTVSDPTDPSNPKYKVDNIVASQFGGNRIIVEYPDKSKCYFYFGSHSNPNPQVNAGGEAAYEYRLTNNPTIIDIDSDTVDIGGVDTISSFALATLLNNALNEKKEGLAILSNPSDNEYVVTITSRGVTKGQLYSLNINILQPFTQFTSTNVNGGLSHDYNYYYNEITFTPNFDFSDLKHTNGVFLLRIQEAHDRGSTVAEGNFASISIGSIEIINDN